MPDGRLGCLDTFEAFVTDQCGGPRICSLTNIESVSWNKVLDDVSNASVTIPISSGVSTTKPCCDCLDLIEPWCHELHFIRNGEIVWQGPIVKVTYGYEQVVIEAEDVIAWLKVRVPTVILDNTKAFPTGQEITDIAVTVLDGAFAEHDPCVLPYILQTDLDQRPTMFANTSVNSEDTGFTASTGTYFDWLEILADLGLDYTALGRRILLGVEDFNLPRVGILTDENILGEIEVTKDGFNMSNRVYVRYQDDDNPVQCANQCGENAKAEGKTVSGGDPQASTTLTAAVNPADLNGEEKDILSVGSTTGFSPKGSILVGGLLMTYAALTATSFTGVTAETPTIATTVPSGSTVTTLAPPCPSCGNNGFVQPCYVFPCPAISESDDIETICYGPIERLFDISTPFNYTTAKQTADAYVAAGKIAPRSIDFASGTKLSQDTPWELNAMIPGQRVSVVLSNLCLPIAQDFRLQEVNYSLDAEGNEEVSISMGLFNAIGGL